jgi:aryl-alcohol dehydrogenase-like predicted oxidoreductase
MGGLTSEVSMTTTHHAAGTFRMGDFTVNRVGYGAMQLAGPGVFGPPKDRDTAIAVLREAVASGVDHIDTSDFYGPHVTNQIIREALHPYAGDLTIVTKVGATRGDDASWIMAREPEALVAQVHDNLRNLGLEQLDVVNLRVGGVHEPDDAPIGAQLAALAGLQAQGLIRHLGLSNVGLAQIEEARGIAEIVCVQNNYNIAHRHDDDLIDLLAGRGIAYVPFFPLGGFAPIQSEALAKIAEREGRSPLQLALAWLLHRSPNILLIPGTSSLGHLRENLAVADIQLSGEVFEELSAIGKVA